MNPPTSKEIHEFMNLGPGYRECLELARSSLGTARAWCVIIEGRTTCFLTMPGGEGEFLVATADTWPELMKLIRSIGSTVAALARCREADKKAAGG